MRGSLNRSQIIILAKETNTLTEGDVYNKVC